MRNKGFHLNLGKSLEVIDKNLSYVIGLVSQPARGQPEASQIHIFLLQERTARLVYVTIQRTVTGPQVIKKPAWGN